MEETLKQVLDRTEHCLLAAGNGTSRPKEYSIFTDLGGAPVSYPIFTDPGDAAAGPQVFDLVVADQEFEGRYCLIANLQERLRSEGLTIEDLPMDGEELREVLCDLGFRSALDRTKICKKLRTHLTTGSPAVPSTKHIGTIGESGVHASSESEAEDWDNESLASSRSMCSQSSTIPCGTVPVLPRVNIVGVDSPSPVPPVSTPLSHEWWAAPEASPQSEKQSLSGEGLFVGKSNSPHRGYTPSMCSSNVEWASWWGSRRCIPDASPPGQASCGGDVFTQMESSLHARKLLFIDPDAAQAAGCARSHCSDTPAFVITPRVAECIPVLDRSADVLAELEECRVVAECPMASPRKETPPPKQQPSQAQSVAKVAERRKRLSLIASRRHSIILESSDAASSGAALVTPADSKNEHAEEVASPLPNASFFTPVMCCASGGRESESK